MFDKKLICPICSCEYVHLTNSRINNDGYKGNINVYIDGYCENNHNFTIRLKQLKGNTFITAIDTTLPPQIEMEVKFIN